ncbi:hypothetical protein [Streptomyces sp. TE5632]
MTVLRESRRKTDTVDVVIHEATTPGADDRLRLFTGASAVRSA